MSKKKAPALHERRGREDISTRPPRLAGYPIKLAGNARLHRLSLAADSCVNRKYYGGDPGVGQRKTGLHTIPPSGTRRRRPGARFSLGQVLGSHEGHIKWPSARAESTKIKRPAPGMAMLTLLAAEMAAWVSRYLADFNWMKGAPCWQGAPFCFCYFGVVDGPLLRVRPGYAGAGFGD